MGQSVSEGRWAGRTELSSGGGEGGNEHVSLLG